MDRSNVGDTRKPYSFSMPGNMAFENKVGQGTVLRGQSPFPFNMGRYMDGDSLYDTASPFTSFMDQPGHGTVLRDSHFFPFNMGNSMDGVPGQHVLRPQRVPQEAGDPGQDLPENGPPPAFPPMMFGYRMPRQTGTHFGNLGANFLGNLAVNQLGNFLGAADRVASDINAGMGGLQRAMTNAANRQMFADQMRQRERMFNRLTSAMFGGGGQLNGISDTASNLRVGGPNVTTNITAQPLGLSQILQADNEMRNSPLGNYSPGRTVSPQAQGELNQLLRAQARDMVPNAERALIDANEPFARDIQSARSNQFLGLGGLLSNLQSDQIDNQARNLPYLLQMMGY